MKNFFKALAAVLVIAALALGYFLFGATDTAQPDIDGAGVSATRSTPTSIEKNGEYTSPEDVALYINTYHKLPKNYITKNEAKKMGWDSEKGNLDEVAPGKSIGGDRYGNYEKKLPQGEKYKECDVNYHGGYRGAERLIFTSDGTVYYTNDHYNSFERLY